MTANMSPDGHRAQCFYDTTDPQGRATHEPQCVTCADLGLVRPWGTLRHAMVWLLDFDPPGTATGWRTPHDEQWPCPACNPTRLDVWQAALGRCWRAVWRAVCRRGGQPGLGGQPPV